MNIRTILLSGLMLIYMGIAHAADVLKVQDIEVSPGESTTVAIALDNSTSNLMGWQCDIVLPEGLTLALKANGRPIATLGERFATTGHSISSNVLANGAYRFIATSMGGEAIPGNSGTLFNITIQTEASLPAGTILTGTVKNIEFNTQDNQKVIPQNVTFKISIKPNQGDVNGDGKVDTEDVTNTISNIIGQNPDNFNKEATDVNGDGKISIADVVGIILKVISGH